MKERNIIIIFFAFAAFLRGLAFDFMTGDLLFQVKGKSEFSDAISAATGRGDSIDFVHVAIVFIDEDETAKIIEASPEEGVRVVSLGSFLDKSPRIGDDPGIVVKRLNIDFPKTEAIEKAKTHLGEPYDWYYLPDNGRMYCSELVYDSFLTADGEHIFQARPMNFRFSDGTMPQFWVRIYEELGIDVPEGVPGTNPNDMSRDPNLSEVYRYF